MDSLSSANPISVTLSGLSKPKCPIPESMQYALSRHSERSEESPCEALGSAAAALVGLHDSAAAPDPLSRFTGESPGIDLRSIALRAGILRGAQNEGFDKLRMTS